MKTFREWLRKANALTIDEKIQDIKVSFNVYESFDSHYDITKIYKNEAVNILKNQGNFEKIYNYDSFNNNLLDYPVYTKPVDFNGMKVPEILLQGDPKKVDEWRYEQALQRTKDRRPDLMEDV